MEREIGNVCQRARERQPGMTPQIISNNGPQFVSKHFREFNRIAGLIDVRTFPYEPRSNGKTESRHLSLRGECIRPGALLSADDARRLPAVSCEGDNTMQLYSVIGFVSPKDKVEGRSEEIFAEAGPQTRGGPANRPATSERLTRGSFEGVDRMVPGQYGSGLFRIAPRRGRGVEVLTSTSGPQSFGRQPPDASQDSTTLLRQSRWERMGFRSSEKGLQVFSG